MTNLRINDLNLKEAQLLKELSVKEQEQMVGGLALPFGGSNKAKSQDGNGLNSNEALRILVERDGFIVGCPDRNCISDRKKD